MAERTRPDVQDPEVLAAALEVARHLDLEACMGALARETARLCGGGTVLCYRYTASGFDLELAADTLPAESPLRSRVLTLDGRVLDDEVPLEGRRFEDGRPLGWAAGAASAPSGAVLALPLALDGERSGLVLLLDPPAGAVAERAGALARAASPAVANALRVRDLKDLMVRDDTADCYNRRYFDEHLAGEVARAVRFGGRLALIFLDMDNLKDVNTRHGHAAGSRVLYEASLRVNRSIRTIDRLFRFGGDEFCILLPETDAVGAREVAERVRRTIAGEPFLVESTGGEMLTASLGVAAFPEHGRSAEALLEAADRAMRGVKVRRKNAIGMPRADLSRRETP